MGKVVEGRPRRPLLLIVEDDPAMVRCIEREARSFVHCLGAATLSEARAVLFERSRIAGVTLDRALGDGEDGLELIPEIQDQHPAASIAVISGVLDATGFNRVTNDDQLEFLAKPCPPERICAFALRASLGAPTGLTREMMSSIFGFSEQFGLSPRERAVVSVAARFGAHHDVLRRQLDVGARTMQQHVRAILRKTGEPRLQRVVEAALAWKA